MQLFDHTRRYTNELLLTFHTKRIFSSLCVDIEAEYTFRLHKEIVPLRLQPRYYPDGWLGALTGSKLVFDFSDANNYDVMYSELVRELGSRGLADDTACMYFKLTMNAMNE